MGDKALVFILDGKRHELNVEELTGREAKEFRAETGVSFRRAISSFTEEGGGDVDLDTIAGIVWLARRQAGDQVAFDEVLGSITYNSDFAVEAAEVDPPEA